MKKYSREEKITNMRLKIINTIGKKLMACLVLVAMFTGYILPMGNVFAKDYSGEYIRIKCTNHNVLKTTLDQIRWDEYKNLYFATNSDKI